MADRLREGSKSSVEEQRDNVGINQHKHFYSDVQIKLVIPNHHGENLVGILHDTSSKELVIVCHGIKSVKERIPMVSLAAAIGKIGISAFRFDFAGNGESEGSFRYGNYHREAEDLHAVVQHFRGIGRIITMIVGHSKGGNVVLLYAAKYHDVHRVINISGRFDLKKGSEGRLGKNFLERIENAGFIDVNSKSGKFQYRVTKESLMDRLSTDVPSACHLISEDCSELKFLDESRVRAKLSSERSMQLFVKPSLEFSVPLYSVKDWLALKKFADAVALPCRVLTIHGSMDQIVPVKDALEFDEVIANHTLRIIDGADHEFTLHQNELVQVALDFIRNQNQCNDIADALLFHARGRSSICPKL
ncbi:hypothetical protein BVRB_2g034590 isoform D [Beta vulgaris subsp. vulgaris]|nr:hypothetical protein BVRB_2g034590 isoform D [Beta vulgaris subsp. vulgaris]